MEASPGIKMAKSLQKKMKQACLISQSKSLSKKLDIFSMSFASSEVVVVVSREDGDFNNSNTPMLQL